MISLPAAVVVGRSAAPQGSAAVHRVQALAAKIQQPAAVESACIHETQPNPTLPPFIAVPRESDIRGYAFHLYEQSNCAHGHDLDNWFEATACLQANIPYHRSATRLHAHIPPQGTEKAPSLQ